MPGRRQVIEYAAPLSPASQPTIWRNRRASSAEPGPGGSSHGRTAGTTSRLVSLRHRGGRDGRQQSDGPAVLTKLHETAAKAVLIGDTEQLQTIEAGAAFRAIAERTGY